MAEETLLSAARRVVRDFNIDMDKGGIITVATQRSVETLHKMVLATAEAEKNKKKEHNQ